MESFNKAPVTARINPDDINPLLSLLLKTKISQNRRNQARRSYLCPLTPLHSPNQEKRKRVSNSETQIYIKKGKQNRTTLDEKGITNLWLRFYLSSHRNNKRKTQAFFFYRSEEKKTLACDLCEPNE